MECDGKIVVDHKASVDPYFELYFMTEERGLRSLQNLAMDCIREYTATEGLSTTTERCDRVFERTKPGSPLRMLLVHQFLFSWSSMKKSSQLAQSALRARLRMKNGEAFMMELFEAVRRKCGKSGWKCPNDKTGCYFHLHEEGEDCHNEQE